MASRLLSKGGLMIIEFLLSFGVLCLTATMCSLTSGGFIWEIIEPALLPGVLLILAMMIFLSGYGKSFIKIFSSAKTLKKTELLELKTIEASLSFSFKALVFISSFFMLIGAIYYYLNIDDRQTLGPNLATIICSFYYLAFFGMMLITLKAKLRRNIINVMTEESDAEKKTASLSKKEIILKTFKILISIALIVGLYLLVMFTSTINHTEQEPLNFYYLRDLPGLIYIFIPTFLLLTISGNFKIFFCALKCVFKNQKVSVSQKALSVNSIKTFCTLLILEGIMTTLGGFMGMLVHLEDRSALGVNFTVACVPLIYALLLNLVLLPVESKVSLLCDSE